MNNSFKAVAKMIKKYNNIVIARHIGADPDALGSQLALREMIKNMYPNKKVLAIGNPSSRFKFMGTLDKCDDITEPTLLIVLDTPDIKRIDGAILDDYDYVIKIDHHPVVDDFANLSIVMEDASSTAQILLELFFANRFKITESIARLLYLGVISDTDRFLHDYTSVKTFALVTKLLEETNIDFTSLYAPLYMRPLAEIRFQGYIYQNMEITENGLAYIKITDDLLKEYGVDSASAGNMVNDLKFVNEIITWAFFTEDKKSNLIRVNIRSRGPYINEIASKYNGGGHKYASGARLTSPKQIDDMIEDLDQAVLKYKENMEE